MSNLIITIISIALVAITALVGVYFLQDGTGSAVAKSRAAMVQNESQQVYAAAQLYMADNGLSSFNDVQIGALTTSANKYLGGLVPIIGLPTYMSGATEVGCGPSLDSIRMYMRRGVCQENGKNAVDNFLSEDPLPGACYTNIQQDFSTKPVTDPLVAMCLKINAGKVFPAGTTFASNGLPYGTGAGSSGAGPSCGGAEYMGDPNQEGYCYITEDYGGKQGIAYLYTGN